MKWLLAALPVVAVSATILPLGRYRPRQDDPSVQENEEEIDAPPLPNQGSGQFNVPNLQTRVDVEHNHNSTNPVVVIANNGPRTIVELAVLSPAAAKRQQENEEELGVPSVCCETRGNGDQHCKVFVLPQNALDKVVPPICYGSDCDPDGQWATTVEEVGGTCFGNGCGTT